MLAARQISSSTHVGAATHHFVRKTHVAKGWVMNLMLHDSGGEEEAGANTSEDPGTSAVSIP